MKVGFDLHCLFELTMAQIRSMRLHLMRLEVHLAIEDDEFLIQAFASGAEIMLSFEVMLEHVVVFEVLPPLRLTPRRFANVTLLVAISHVNEQLVIRVKVRRAVFTESMVLLHVSSERLRSVKGVLVCEDLLVLYAQIAE